MGGYGLPALDVRPPQQVDTLGNLQKLMALKQMGQQQQLNQQQLVGEQQRNEMGALQLQDQKVLRDSAKGLDWSQPDTFQKWIANAQQNGVSPQTLSALTLQRAQYQEQLAKTDTATLAANKERNNQLLGHIDAVYGIKDPAKRAQAAQAQAQQILQSGLAKDPQSIQMLQGMATGQVVPTDEQLEGYKSGLLDDTAQTEKRLKETQIAESAQKTEQSKAETALKNMEVQWGGNPQMQEARYRYVLQKLAAHQDVSPEDMAAATAYEASQRKTTSTSDTLGVMTTNTSQPAGLASFRKGAAGGAGAGGGAAKADTRSSIVDLIGNYQADPQLVSRMMYKHPEILGLIHEKYPDWDQTSYLAKAAAMKDLAPNGKTGQQTTSYNAFLGHTGDVWDAIDSLKNSGYPDWNKPMNWLIQHTGDPRVAEFVAKMQPVQKEFESFLLNNRALYAEDRADAQKLLNPNQSPEQMRGVLQSLVNTGKIRMEATNDTFKRVVGRDIPNLYTPRAQEVINKLSPQAAPQGGGQFSHVSASGKFGWDGTKWVPIPGKQ